MKKIIATLTVIVLSVSLVFQSAYVYNEVKRPSYEYLKSVTVKLNTKKDDKRYIATGIVVKITEDYTYVLTNHHMAPEGSEVYVKEPNKLLKTEVLKRGVVYDLALLRLTGRVKGKRAIKGIRNTFEQERIYSVGMYLGFNFIYAEGTVAGWIHSSTSGLNRLINMPALSGCSGSGIFDKDGYLVAVLFAGSKYTMFAMDTAKAWCVPYTEIKLFLEGII